jgi:hypothetical protein
VAENAERGHRNCSLIRGWRALRALPQQRYRDGTSLWARQRLEHVVVDNLHEVTQGREIKSRLRLRWSASQDGKAALLRPVDRRLPDASFADARFTFDGNAGESVRRASQELFRCRQLRLSAHQVVDQ